MIPLTPQQIEAVTAGGDAPLTLIDPQTKTAYVLVRKDAYDELTAAADVERLAASIDWKAPDEHCGRRRNGSKATSQSRFERWPVT